MTIFALMGALEVGLIFGLVAMGAHLSFRVLAFPDLTVEGSFPLGAAVAATLIVIGWPPLLATLGAAMAGAAAGVVTAYMNVRFRILHLLAGILTAVALYSVNLRVMGRPNMPLLGQDTVFTPLRDLGLPNYIMVPIVLAVVVLVLKLLLDRFLHSEIGLAMRATGANPDMARANGVDTGRLTILGLAMSNALVALAGGLFAQTQGAADISMGVGVIIVGIAAVIIGETLMPSRRIVIATLAVVVGSIVYRIAIALALNADFIGLTASDVNLITSALVALALIWPQSPFRLLTRRRRTQAGSGA